VNGKNGVACILHPGNDWLTVITHDWREPPVFVTTKRTLAITFSATRCPLVTPLSFGRNHDDMINVIPLFLFGVSYMFLLIFNRDSRIAGRYLSANRNGLIRNQVTHGRSSCLRMVNVVAAGKGSTVAHPTIMRNVISLCGKTAPNIVYLGTPSKDSAENWRTTGLPYVNCGYPVTRILLWNQTEDEKENQNPSIKELILNADVILVSGGSSKECILKWKEWGLDELLISVAMKKKSPVLVGGSAGALCWFAGNGLGLIPALFVPHFDTNVAERGILPPEQKLERYQELSCCICMDENAAMVISSDRLLLQDSFVSRSTESVSSRPIKPLDFPDADFTIISTDGKAKGYLMRRESIPTLETLEIGKIKRFNDLFHTQI